MGTFVEVVKRGVAAAVLLLGAATAARAQDEASAAALGTWVAAVRAHQPGQADQAAGVAASMSYADRRVLDPAMNLFLRVLHAPPVRPRSKAAAEIAELVRSVRRDPGVAPFLRRAVMLHTDAVIYASRYPVPPEEAPAPTRPATGRDGPTSPLLSDNRLVQHLDGQVLGVTPAAWHWPFARFLFTVMLDGPETPEADRAFVSAWYHAVAAYLFATSHYGDLNMHLDQASRVLPDDPDILFDRGCHSEALGLPFHQALARDPSNRPGLQQLAIDLPSETSADSEAEQLFRRALERNPDYAEARVRLARCSITAAATTRRPSRSIGRSPGASIAGRCSTRA